MSNPPRGLATTLALAAAVFFPAIAVAQPAPLLLIKTVGTDPATCAATEAITGTAPVQAFYCYRIENTGVVTYTTHNLVDSELGTLLQDYPLILGPGASVFVTASATISDTVVNTATWTAFNSDVITDTGTSITDTATVTVLPPELSLLLTKTVGLDPATCAATKAITGTGPVQAIYCYRATNTGDITLTTHDLVDSELGTILQDYPSDLAPGASVFVTASATISDTVVNTATWTAALSDVITDTVGGVTSYTDTAKVTILPLEPSLLLTKTVGLDPATCATTTAITDTGPVQAIYCYRATNTGNITLTSHDLVDSELGTILQDFAYSLGPGASVFVTESASIGDTVENTATWTARADTGAPVDSNESSALVTILPPSLLEIPTVSHLGLALLALLLLAVAVERLRRSAVG